MTQLVTLGAMPRKQRGTRETPPLRVNIEVYPDEHELVRRAKAGAARKGATFREWMVGAMREKLEREGPE